MSLLFSGVTTATGLNNHWLIQVGSGSYTTSGYSSVASVVSQASNITTGFGLYVSSNAYADCSGAVVVHNIASNEWIACYALKVNDTYSSQEVGNVTLTGTLDRIRVPCSYSKPINQHFYRRYNQLMVRIKQCYL